MKQLEDEANYRIIQVNGDSPHNKLIGADEINLKISVECSELRKFLWRMSNIRWTYNVRFRLTERRKEGMSSKKQSN